MTPLSPDQILGFVHSLSNGTVFALFIVGVFGIIDGRWLGLALSSLMVYALMMGPPV